MRRYELSGPQWNRIAPLLPHPTHHGTAGHPFSEPRPIVNGILWILHTGAPWRDLPERYGPWETVFKAFNRWREDGTWVRIVTSLLDELDDKKQIDHDLWCIDGTVVRASRAAAGGGEKGEPFVAVGRTEGGANARAARPCARAIAGRIHDQGPPGV
jgi:transposase